MLCNAAWLNASETTAASNPTNWQVEFTAGCFKFHADYPVANAAYLVSELNTLEQDLYHLLRIPKLQNEIHIVLFEDAVEYRRYMRNYFPALPDRRAIFIQDRGPGMLFTFAHQELIVDLRHESTHALLSHKAPQKSALPLPLWVDEGIAEYFEVASQGRFNNSPYLEQGNWADVEVMAGSQASEPKESSKIRLQSMRWLEEKEELAQFTDIEYRDSWAWIHFLIHRNQKTRALLRKWIRERRLGIGVSLAKYAEREIPSLERQACDHFSQLAKQRVSQLARASSIKEH